MSFSAMTANGLRQFRITDERPAGKVLVLFLHVNFQNMFMKRNYLSFFNGI